MEKPCHGSIIFLPACRPATRVFNVGVVVPFEDKHPAEASIEKLVALVAADMERVNAMILSRTGSEVTMIPEVANHLISSGGKRLRPMLTLATAGLVRLQGDGHVKLAASVEFMHTATLLHDDVVDESDMRRGKVAARIKWGNEASVLVGDFLLGQAFRMMVEVGSLRALDILSAAATVIAEGEVMQLAAAKNTETTEDEYLAVIRGKTAELFAAACEVGPVIAERPKAEQAACRSYGMNLGIAFQLVDDALDYGGRPRNSARTSATISARARSPCRSSCPSAAARTRSAPSGSGCWNRATSRPRPRRGDCDHAPPPGARGHGRACPPLRRHGPRRAGPVPRRPDEAGAARNGGFLHRPRTLTRRTSKAWVRGPSPRMTARGGKESANLPSSSWPGFDPAIHVFQPQGTS